MPAGAGQPTVRVEPIAEEEPSQRIGRYKLLQKLGEGGCGVVYMAEQTEPVRRRVALKVIKLGMEERLKLFLQVCHSAPSRILTCLKPRIVGLQISPRQVPIKTARSHWRRRRGRVSGSRR